MKEEYWCARYHTAELHGKEVRFKSYYRPRTHGVMSDAVQALKEAGIYEKSADWEEVTIDGERQVFPTIKTTSW